VALAVERAPGRVVGPRELVEGVVVVLREGPVQPLGRDGGSLRGPLAQQRALTGQVVDVVAVGVGGKVRRPEGVREAQEPPLIVVAVGARLGVREGDALVLAGNGEGVPKTARDVSGSAYHEERDVTRARP